MTNKEIVEQLLSIKKWGILTDKDRHSLNLVIKVLEEPDHGKFECRIKIKDLIAMLLEFDMNEKATICTTDEYNENNIVISITDMRGKEE